jgi:hypothetical protein
MLRESMFEKIKAMPELLLDVNFDFKQTMLLDDIPTKD